MIPENCVKNILVVQVKWFIFQESILSPKKQTVCSMMKTKGDKGRK
jgi:hypothetical protein